MKNTRYIFLLFTIILFSAALCFGTLRATEEIKAPIPVFVSILPQAYFVERIGGIRVSTDVLVLPGKSPATYTPTPQQMSRLANAKIFFVIGMPFEASLLEKIRRTVKHLQIVDTGKDIPRRKMAGRHHSQASNEINDHHHTAEGSDPHIWLSPVLVKKQAETILNTLVTIDPKGKSEYRSNYKAFIKDLDILDKKIRRALAPVKGETIFVFHPSFGYFTDEYGLKQMAVEIEGKAPKGKSLTKFIKKAKKENVRVIFVQPQFDQSAARKIAGSLNGAVVSLNPLAEDYIKNLEDMAEKVADALGE